MRTHLLSLAAVALSAMPALAMSDSDLRVALEQRFKDDRSGACVAAAVIDNGATARAYVCADPKSQRPYDEHAAFEIGSVTKTMTAALSVRAGRGQVDAQRNAAQGIRRQLSACAQLALRVFSTGAKLVVQGTNQGPIEVASVDMDSFVAESVGAQIDFARDTSGRVIALTLRQQGQVLRGERH
jgi:hypothetical protein